jgi:hypothetical protein
MTLRKDKSVTEQKHYCLPEVWEDRWKDEKENRVILRAVKVFV